MENIIRFAEGSHPQFDINELISNTDPEEPDKNSEQPEEGPFHETVELNLLENETVWLTNDDINLSIAYDQIVEVPNDNEIPPPVFQQSAEEIENNEVQPVTIFQLPDELIKDFIDGTDDQRYYILSSIRRALNTHGIDNFEIENELITGEYVVLIRSLLMHHIHYVARHRDEILRNINNALLERLSCCCVLINQYNEVIYLEDLHGDRVFLKTYRTMNNDGTLETPIQAASRVFNQHIQVKNIDTGEKYDQVDMNQHTVFSQHRHLEYGARDHQGAMVHIDLLIFLCNTDPLRFRLREANVYHVVEKQLKPVNNNIIVKKN